MKVQPLIVRTGLTLFSLMGAGCDPQPSSAGSYDFPQAVIGVDVNDAVEPNDIRAQLLRFAQEHGLHEYRPSDRARQHTTRHPEWWRTRTEFNPPYYKDTEGFDLRLVEISSQCWVVQFHDRTGNWTTYSLREFSNLVQSLGAVSHGNAHILVRPHPDQNYARRQELRTAVDPQQPAEIEEFCVRMGLPDPRIPQQEIQ